MNRNVGLVMGSFHRTQIEEMLDEARSTAASLDLNIVEEVWVPGSMEKPLALKRLLLRDDIDGAVALGIIEKGETSHGLVMAQSAIAAIINLQLELMKPVGVGILGPDIQPSQISSRLRPYGRDAVLALGHML
ncbi:MAG: 6,7-dimethyl-8-ribityllumazine synthase [Parasphingorhabdus sp.]|jgi:6,7-dimethyl-8-ribityllumazine synthase